VKLDRYPVANSGVFFTEKWEMIGGDSSSVARILANWDIDVTLIGNDLGNDEWGRKCVLELQNSGVKHTLSLRSDIETPFEFDVSDGTGTRTCFVEYNQKVWDTLLTAKLAAIENASLIYVDWYARLAAIRALEYASRYSVPVFLNIEQMYQTPDTVQKMLKYAKYCQANLSEADATNPDLIMTRIREMGPTTVLLTLGGRGCIGKTDAQRIEIPATPVNAIDTNSAGAVFSAGFIYSIIQGWEFARALQFATASATLKCANLGLPHFSPDDVTHFSKPKTSW